MKRFLTVVTVAFVCAWVGAQGTNRPSAAQQAKLAERNRSLYQAAIESGLSLSDQDRRNDPLYRAEIYTGLAKQWAKEIEKAARAKEADRVTELGNHLGQVVDRGVIANLEIARQKIEAGSESEKLLFKQRDDAIDVLKPLEESLRQGQGFESLIKTLTEGRTRVEKAAKIDGR